MTPTETWRRIGAGSGLLGSILFVAVFTVEGFIRPGYSASRMFVSALSLGPRGWIQVINVVVVGVSFLLVARALAVQFPPDRASRFGPLLIAIVGLGLLFSGPFVMDPMGTPFLQQSWHGKIHSLLGALVFSLGPASAFVSFPRFRSDPSWRWMAWWTLAAGIVMTVAVMLLKVATLPPPAPPNALTAYAGAIQRVALVALMAWVASVGAAMLKRSQE